MKTLLIRSASGLVYVLSVLIPLLFYPAVWPFVILVYAVLVVYEIFTTCRKASLQPSGIIRCIIISVLWGLFPMAILALMPAKVIPACSSSGSDITLSMFLLVWTFDTFAYLVGRKLGVHKLAPKISPLKTIEGFVGGLVFSTIVAAILYFSIADLPWWFWAGGVFIVAVPGTLGDLAESWLKRKAGVKDSGNLMPGHGGFFDRFDSLLVVIPLWGLWVWLICG